MKRVLTTIASLLIISITWTELLAQETESVKNEVHVKVKKVVNGVETIIDTTLSSDNPAEVHRMLKEFGIESKGLHPDHHKEFNKEIIIDSEGNQSKEIEVHVNVEKSGEANVFEFKDGDQEGIWKSDDGSVIHLNNKDGKVVIDIEGQEGEVLHLENPTDHKVIILKDGEMTEEMKMNMEEVLEDEKIKIILEDMDVKVDVETLTDGKEVKKIHIVSYSFHIKDLNQEDRKALEQTGTDMNTIESGLSAEQLSFYPNPNDGKFRLSYTSDSDAELKLQIRDINGKVVYKEQLSDASGVFETEVDISERSSGIYFLTLMQAGKALTKKLVID